MSQQEKAHYFNALKQAGVTFDKHYREYSTAELKEAYDKLSVGQQMAGAPVPPAPTLAEAAADLAPPVRPADPAELPGQRLNTKPLDEPIRTDEQGRIWYQEEVLKPGYAKPRGRRVLQTMERGVVQETVQDGRYIETFEVAGQGPLQATEIKVTLPSYQTGIYKDPRYPFKVHIYNGVQGFDFFEVAEYYGGTDLVPPTIKRMYVENVLCYDIRTTVQTIQAEYRQLQLTGRIRA